MKRKICQVMVVLLILSYALPSAEALATEDSSEPTAYATGKFSMDVPGETTIQASTSSPLEAGEIVKISAVYTPDSASVDFGLIAPDGLFMQLILIMVSLAIHLT